MSVELWTAPQLSLISRPLFTAPAHLEVDSALPPDDVWVEDGEHLIEFAGRLCYMSQSNPARRTTAEYIENIKKQGHGSVLEHANYSILFEGVSRSFTHELVRHRAGFAYSQLSQRYVDESDTGFVIPPALLDLNDDAVVQEWVDNRAEDVKQYKALSDLLFSRYEHIEDKVTRRKTAREAARSVLPNATETKIVATANVRAWRTMLELRAAEGAEREMRRAAVLAWDLLYLEAPSCFDDFEQYTGADGVAALRTDMHKV